MGRDTDQGSRRAFLKGAAALAPLTALPTATTAAPRTSDPPADIGQSVPKPAHPAADTYQPAFFTPAEWAFVNAACARLIPNDDTGPGAVEVGVPQYIDRQLGTAWADGAIWYMQGPFFETAPEFGYQSQLTPKQQYRLGIKAIEAICQDRFKKTFSQLPADQQDAFLKDLEAGKVTSPDISLKTFFTSFLLENTLEGFFGDPMYGGNKGMAGWKLIAHPGARADFLDFVGEAKPYPYGPVSIYGDRT